MALESTKMFWGFVYIFISARKIIFFLVFVSLLPQLGTILFGDHLERILCTQSLDKSINSRLNRLGKLFQLSLHLWAIFRLDVAVRRGCRNIAIVSTFSAWRLGTGSWRRIGGWSLHTLLACALYRLRQDFPLLQEGGIRVLVNVLIVRRRNDGQIIGIGRWCEGTRSVSLASLPAWTHSSSSLDVKQHWIHSSSKSRNKTNFERAPKPKWN